MSTNHNGGNLQNSLALEEHDGANNAKRVSLVGNVSITANSKVTVQPLSAWPDPKGYIGLVTITGSLAAASGNVTLDAGSRTGIVGNITLSDPKGFIGLVTVVGSLSPAAGNVTLDAGSRTGILGNVTLSNPNTYIGLTTSTLGAGTQFIGLVTVVQSSSARTITGNLTLSDAKTYIGLVTATPSWGSEATVYATVISSSGNTTLFVAPASNRFFVKDLHVSSLGRSEIQFLSGATIFIPLTSLATTSGFAAFYGEMGKPARAATDALVANLNGAATVSIGVTYRIAP